MNFIKNLISKRAYEEHQTKTTTARTAPNSWGILEYNGKQYKFIKGQKDNPKNETYNSFIADVVRQFDKIKVRKDNFICQTC